MSETEPFLNCDELEYPREHKSISHLPIAAAILLTVGIGIGVIWRVVIPNYIQQEIDSGKGYYILDKLNISLGNKKVDFDVKSQIHFIQDPNQVSITAELAQNKLDILLRRHGNDYMPILTLGTPHFFYSTDRAHLNLSFQDVISVKNIELLSTLISDFAMNNSKSYSVQVVTFPIVSIPGFPGSWKLNFIRALDFTATNLWDSGFLNNISIKEYQMKSVQGDDGLPKVTISANASMFNSESISLSLIDASLETQVFYKDHHVLDISISNIFLNPSKTMDWTALQELIFRYSEGEEVYVRLKNFRWNTDQLKLKWMAGLVYGLDVPLALPKLSGDGIFQLCRSWTTIYAMTPVVIYLTFVIFKKLDQPTEKENKKIQ